jgi:hypothetical protein
VYSEEGRAKLDFQTSSDNNGKWNREHTFPRSRAGYFSIEKDETRDGIDIYWPTSADSLRHGNSDGHALRASDGYENSIRNNQHYGEYVGPEGTLGSFRGDVARSVLYLEMRYNGLEIVNGYPEIVGQLGDLATLLEWHRNDPPDDFEMNRNNVVYKWQKNRNPLIDQPDLVEYIWGNQVGDVWNQPSASHEVFNHNVQIYPNPTSNHIQVKGLQEPAVIELYSMHGKRICSHMVEYDSEIALDIPNGMYLVRINTEGKIKSEKLIVIQY